MPKRAQQDPETFLPQSVVLAAELACDEVLREDRKLRAKGVSVALFGRTS